MTAAEVAAQIFGRAEGFSGSNGAKAVRTAAREMFPRAAGERYQRWDLTPEQVAAIKGRLGR